MKKGLKFTPTTRGDYFEVKKGLEELTRKIKIRETFFGQEYTDKSLVRCKSNRPFSSKNKDVNNLCRNIEALEPEEICVDDNLSSAERSALSELKNNKNIILKPADKGSSVIIMNSSYYRDKLVMNDHLLSESYTKANEDCDEKVMEQMEGLIKRHSKCLTEKEIEFILKPDWKTSEFYVLPKIHKCRSIIEAISSNNDEDVLTEIKNPPDLKGRPIVAGCSTPTRGMSVLISKILKPIVECQKTFIKDDWDVFRKLPESTRGTHKLFGCDISSLYTSIPHKLGLKAIKYWINKRRDLIDDRFSEEFILEAIELMLKNNNFLFNGEMYTQLIGTAMGHVFAPQYACLVIGYLEEENLLKEVLPKYFSIEETKIIEEFLSRYMDDGFTLLPESVDSELFLRCLNELHPSIRFTLEPATHDTIDGLKVQKLDFLDITIMLFESGKIETDIHYKPTNSHQYLDFNSFHPDHIKNNIPFNLAKRIICFVSNSAKMEARLIELKTWLRNCGYPPHIIDRSIHNARLQGPAPKPKDKEDVLPLITTFSSNLDTTHITKNIRTLISNRQHGRLEDVLQNVSVVSAYRQPSNLRHLLCRAKYSDQDLQVRDTQATVTQGLVTCSDKRCKLCHTGYINPCKSFTCSNNRTWEIKSHVTCNSTNVIYFLSCNMCNNQTTYIGKTWRRLRERMNDHISKSKSGKGTDKFDKHVHECGTKNKNLSPPFFNIKAMMVLSSRDLLETYESYFHRNGFDTMNCTS